MGNGIQMSFVICLTFICGVIASLHTSSNVHRRFEPDQVKTKAMRLVCCCFPAKTKTMRLVCCCFPAKTKTMRLVCCCFPAKHAA